MDKDKNRLKIIFGTLAIIIAVGGFFLLKWVKENNQNQAVVGDEYIPEAEISEEQERQTIVSLYFPSKEERKLSPEARLIDVKELVNMPYEKLMNLLMEGPKNEKLDRIIPKGTKILRIFTENDILVFDLSKDFLNYDTEKENEKDNLIKSIVNTVTELTEINGVKFLIEGEVNEQFNEIYRRSQI